MDSTTEVLLCEKLEEFSTQLAQIEHMLGLILIELRERK